MSETRRAWIKLESFFISEDIYMCDIVPRVCLHCGDVSPPLKDFSREVDLFILGRPYLLTTSYRRLTVKVGHGQDLPRLRCFQFSPKKSNSTQIRGEGLTI